MRPTAPHMEQLEPTELLRRAQERSASERVELHGMLADLASGGAPTELLLTLQHLARRIERLEAGQL